jgi:hypothetical protein
VHFHLHFHSISISIFISFSCYFSFSFFTVFSAGDGFSVAYRTNKLFCSFVRRVCSLPFVPIFLVPLAMIILNDFATKLDVDSDKSIADFAKSLLAYITNTWFTTYGLQDWNIFDVDCQLVPITNNANEAQNARLNTNYPVHPQLYVFLMHVMLEFNISEEKVEEITNGELRPGGNELYKALKVIREAAKDSLIEDLRTADNQDEKKEILSNYMGKMGATANKFVDRKVAEDYTETDLAREAGGLQVGEVAEGGLAAAAAASAPGKGRGKQATARTRGARGAGRAPWSRGVPAEAVNIMSFITENNFDVDISEHITKNNLNLEPYLTTRSNGDCFYDALWNLISLNKLNVNACDALELRRLLVNSIEKHPSFQVWLQSPSVWRCKRASFTNFKRTHCQPGVFTDNEGIILMTACHFLNVNIYIVSSSNNAQDPMTKICAPEGSSTIFYIGYTQVYINIIFLLLLPDLLLLLIPGFV